jgi:predicted acylesterase/phospholipase RssA
MSDLASADYSAPSRTCDIVMKGGITSGVVYPHAICELAKTYRFARVGGTSAGAIAAAATAAAELGRDRGGFRELSRLPAWIGGDRNLLRLFQPQPGTRGLFRMLVAALEHPRRPARHVLAAGLRQFPLLPLLGALPGTAIVLVAVLAGGGAAVWAAVVGGVVLALGGLFAGLALAVIRRLTRGVPENLFGLCSGAPASDGPEPLALTPWLTELLERCAGRVAADGSLPQVPLTFGDLAQDGPELAMMTTNLTNHTAHRLPWDSQEYWFDPGELRRLFPPHVVDHMAAKPPPLPEAPARRARAEAYRERLRPLLPLPAPADLPVVFAARMSLSFPILLSAVPLHRIDFSLASNQGDAPSAERCWFSDGGVSSNFPVHFFDAPLPRHPTFAVNLRPFHPDRRESANQAENVWMVESAVSGQLSWWYRPASEPGTLSWFMGQIVRTMQNRVDDALLRMPGVRDRTVHVSLSNQQGGMNLVMEPETIELLTRRGREAGAKLVRRFTEDRGDGEPLSWRDHRWTRLRSAMPALAQILGDFAEAYRAAPPPGEAGYVELLTGPDAPPYAMSQARRAQAADLIEQLVTLGIELKAAEAAFTTGSPSPASRARLVPPD